MTKLIKTNFRVVVEPRRLGDYGWVSMPDNFGGQTRERIAKDYEERCDEMVDQIKRHVDNVGWARAEFDLVCAYCGYEPEPAKETGEPQCCTKAQEEWAAEGQAA